jgi:hypothetical protein
MPSGVAVSLVECLRKNNVTAYTLGQTPALCAADTQADHSHT